MKPLLTYIHNPNTVPDAPAWPTTFRALMGKRHTLLLQGPMGWFFDELARVLQHQGQQVSKVHFNGGDQLFWRHPGALPFRAPLGEFGPWLQQLITQRGIDAVVLFGQMRPVHCIAREVARQLGISVFVFEEGYLRPHYVTLERRGVNALSHLPRHANFYTRQNTSASVPAPEPTRQHICRTALIAAAYGLAVNLRRSQYPHEVYHRSMHPVVETLRWARSWWRHMRYQVSERGVQEQLCSSALSKRWFLVPLQVQGDSQVVHHSRFQDMHHFITEVMSSFAQAAPADVSLVIKHHPMDRAYSDYTHFIREEAQRRGLQGRVVYLHDQHLPTLLDHTLGVVTINSTVGLQALHHRTPVITLGESFYGIPGLVHQGSLDAFWRQPGRVNTKLYQRFRHHLIQHTQLNASFYAQAPALEAALQQPRPLGLAPDGMRPSP